MPVKKLLTVALLAFSAVFGVAIRDGRATTISPVDFNFIVSPGDVIHDVLHVYNEDPHPVTLKPQVFNFTFRPDDEFQGAPDFYPAEAVRSGHELAAWIALRDDEPFTIAPRARVDIPFTIEVPKTAQPGGHFGAIHISLFQDARAREGSGVGIVAAASALVFVHVNGEARSELSVTQFSADRYVHTRLPADFTIRIANGGTTHLIPVGTIIITDVFGRRVASLPVNADDKRRVLPGATRRFNASWFRTRMPYGLSEYVAEWQNFALGPYTATLVLQYEDAGQKRLLSAETGFWVVPWMVVLTGLLCSVLFLLSGRALLGKYERRVIARYEAKKRQKEI